MNGSVKLDILDRIRIASPCPARWEDMAGDERRRFCGQCRLDVYNLSAMTRAEATALVSGAEGRLCAGFFRRADGTVLTRDCPVGLRAARAAAAAGLRRIGAAAALVVGAVLSLGTGGSGWRLRQAQPFATLCRWLDPATSSVRGQVMIMGDIAAPTPPPKAPPSSR